MLVVLLKEGVDLNRVDEWIEDFLKLDGRLAIEMERERFIRLFITFDDEDREITGVGLLLFEVFLIVRLRTFEGN